MVIQFHSFMPIMRLMLNVLKALGAINNIHTQLHPATAVCRPIWIQTTCTRIHCVVHVITEISQHAVVKL